MRNVTYYNASAGSGKTYKLTHILADLIKEGKVKPDQVIMTTFTVKAANEMKERAKMVLYENGLLDEANQLDQAMIGTVHSVANSLIKKYWFFLGLSPDMGVMAEEDTAFYTSQSLAELPTQEELEQLQAFCEGMGMQSSFQSGKTGVNYDLWKEDIVKIINYTTNYEIEDYERSIRESLDYIRQFVNPQVTLHHTADELRGLLQEYTQYAYGQKESKKKQELLMELKRLEQGVDAPTVVWYKRLNQALCAWTKNAPGDDMREELAQMWHSQMVYDMQEKYIRLLFKLAERWKEGFRTFKKERNLLDYNDMEKYLHDLLGHAELAKEISLGYRYLFVDEYQDCSPIQVKIFDRLSELMEHSYWVGDYKQAIFGFRGSDITLTKAVVDRISKGDNGCDIDHTLRTSYRSLPDIVKVCNETFKHTFEGVLDEKSIVLENVNRTNDEHIDSIRYWNMENKDLPQVASHVAYLVKHGVKPSDIAVLARRNDYLGLLAASLKDIFNIPASKEGLPVTEHKATKLVMALLALVLSDKDSLAKASIAVLTEEGYDTKRIIEEKLLLDADEQRKEVTFLNEVPLVKRLLELRPMLTQQSVGALIETMIIEMDLYNEVKRLDQMNDIDSCLNTIIQTGYAYEQHCLQMNLPATVNGFMNYLEVMLPSGPGDVNGVQLFTYHTSKGLEWKYVILTQLCEKKKDPERCVKMDIFGIHFNYVEQPSAVTPYPEVYIRVMPFIYGPGNTKTPADIQQQIVDTTLYQEVSCNSLSEENRLLYVGMTRPRDVLIMALEPHGNNVHALQWLEDVGLTTVKPDANSDILGVGCKFKDDTLTLEQLNDVDSYHYNEESVQKKSHCIPYKKELCEAERKYVSPSSIHAKGDVKEHYAIGERIPMNQLVDKTMADVGDCIHQIFCSIEQHIDDKDYYSKLIESYGLSGSLVDHMAIRKAWENLVAWLTKEYGEAVQVYHERPFTLLKEGQVYTGSIDLVWKTAQGDVLVDFKTCPLGEKYVLDSDSEHYAGWYAGQLDAYTDALEAAGETVLKRFIFYPVSGLLCEVERAFDFKPQCASNVLHVFGIDGLDLDELWDLVPDCCSDVDDIKMLVMTKDTDDGDEMYTVALEGFSAQGVKVTLTQGEFTHLHVEIPWMAMWGDLEVAFGIMKALRKLYPDCEIYLDKNADKQLALCDENLETLLSYRFTNLYEMGDMAMDNILSVNGVNRSFFFTGCQGGPEEKEAWARDFADRFVDVQWRYGKYEDAEETEFELPECGSYTVRVLINSDMFVGVCQHMAMYVSSGDFKDIPRKDFLEVMKGSEYLEMVDAMQFVLHEMPDEEWQRLYDLMPGRVIWKPRTFLLRWNPGISSFKLESYQKAMAEYPDGFATSWSVYEWEKARDGDLYYMLRTGDEHAGIVFCGEFTSEPEPGEDWAGKGKQRYYMNINCHDCVPADSTPALSLEVLEKELSSINWRKGHSGELLPDELAEKLEELWEKMK